MQRIENGLSFRLSLIHILTREIVSVNLNGTRFPAAIVSKKDFDFMRQDGDIGSMDYDQAVSYTHLDVYKRQALTNTISSLQSDI